MKDDQRIVIEHIERKIDEAEIERQKLAREESIRRSESDSKAKRLSFVLFVIGIVLVAIGFGNSLETRYIAIIGFLIIGVAGVVLPVSSVNRNNQQK